MIGKHNCRPRSIDIESYTLVDINTLRNAFPAVPKRLDAAAMEDRIDNRAADAALREVRKKGTKPWSTLKRELDL